MSDLKTKPNNASAVEFIKSVEHPVRQKDGLALLDLMKDITGEQPVMWGGSIIGFGSYHFKYASGREGDWMKTGFSPRKSNISLYIMDGFDEYQDLLKKLGKHKTGKSCLYITKLADVNLEVLKQLISLSYHSAAMGQQVK